MILGIDVGATNTKAVLYDTKVRKKIVVPSEGTQTIIDIISRFECEAVGIGVPGTVDRKTGKIISAPNLRSLDGVNLAKIIEKKFGIPAIVENDANCFGFAELRLGYGRKFDNFVLLTLGSGIGGSIIIDGKLYFGRGNAGEFGELRGLKGKRFEDYISLGALKRMCRRRGVSFDRLSQELKKGNRKAIEIMHEFGAALGILLTNITFAFDPQAIVLTGGLSKFARYFKQKAIEVMKSNALDPPKVLVSKLGYFAGAIGAALLAMERI